MNKAFLKHFFSVIWPSFLFPVGALILGFALWDFLPEALPMHYSWSGEVDRLAPRMEALLTLPFFSIFLTVFVAILARMDAFFYFHAGQRKALRQMLVAISFLLFGIQVGILATALMPETLPMTSILFVSAGLFLILFGLSLRDLQPSSAVGVRLPWNRRDRDVWRRTHDLFYRWFTLAGGIFLITAFVFPAPLVSLILVTLAILVPTALSFSYARSFQRRKTRDEN